MAAWWDAYCTTGGEPLTLAESQESSPVLVSALMILRDTMARRQKAELEIRSKRHGDSAG